MTRRWIGFLCVALAVIALTACPVQADQAAPAAVSDATYIEFILDASISMTARIGRDTRLSIAKSVMEKLIDDLPDDPNLYLALRIYGAEIDPSLKPCDDSVLVQPFAPASQAKKNMIDRIRSMQAKGMTPIAKSLELAANDFPVKQGARNIVILVTDGEESCGGDPCAVSARLQQQGLILKPYVVGFALTDKQAELVKCIGEFYQASDTDSLLTALTTAVKQAIQPATIEIQAVAGNTDVTERARITVRDGSGQPVPTTLTPTFPRRVRATVDEGEYYVSGELVEGSMVLRAPEVRVSAKSGELSQVRLDFGSLEGRVILRAYASGVDVSADVDVQVLAGGTLMRNPFSGMPLTAALPAGAYTFIVLHRQYESLRAVVPVTVVAGVDTPVNVNLGDLPAGISVGVTFMGKSVANACRVSIADARATAQLSYNSGSDSFEGPASPGTYDIRVTYAGVVQAEKTVRGVAVEGGRTTRVMVELDDILGVLRARVVAGTSDVTIEAGVTASGAPGRVSLPVVGLAREAIVLPGGYAATAEYRGITSDPKEAYVQPGKVTEIELEVMIPGRIVLFPTIGGREQTSMSGMSASAVQNGMEVASFTAVVDALEARVEPGTYSVVARTTRPYRQEVTIDNVAVASGATVTLNVDFKPGNTLIIKVVSEGKPFNEAAVKLYTSGSTDWDYVDRVSDGVWQVVLPDGLYDITVEPQISGMRAQRVTGIELAGGVTVEKTVDVSGTGLLRVMLLSGGKPFNDASVRVYFNGGSDWNWMQRVSQGVWELKLPEGTHDVEVHSNISGMEPKRVRGIVVAGGATVEHTIDMGGTGLLRITLISDGKLFNDASVAYYVNGGSDWDWMQRVSQGVWELKVPEGTHDVEVSPNISGMEPKRVRGIVVAGGATVEHTIDMGGAGLLRIKVLSDGKPYDDASVQVHFNGGTDWDYMEHVSPGTWELKVPEGTHDVQVSPYTGGMEHKRLRGINVPSGATIEQTIDIGGTALLRLILLNDGRPVENAYISVIFGGSDDWDSMSQVSPGVFELTVPQGTHDIQIEPYVEGHTRRTIRGVQVAGGTVERTVDLGGVPTLRVIVTANGQPTSEATVELFTADEEWLGTLAEVSTGRFEMKVPAGSYMIMAIPTMAGFLPGTIESLEVPAGVPVVEARLDLPTFPWSF